MRDSVERQPGAGSRSVFNDDLLAPYFRQAIADDPGRQIRTAAGRKTDIEPHDARRKSVRKRRAPKRRKRGGGGQLQCSATRKSHDSPPLNKMRPPYSTSSTCFGSVPNAFCASAACVN